MVGLPENIAKRFCLTHFFNPPRYLQLVEVVAGSQTQLDVIETITKFLENNLGKGVVLLKILLILLQIELVFLE